MNQTSISPKSRLNPRVGRGLEQLSKGLIQLAKHCHARFERWKMLRFFQFLRQFEVDYISPPDEFLRINKAWSESQGARRRWRNHSTLFKRWVIREALQNKFRASVGIYGRYRAFADAQFDYELPESIKNVQVQIEIEVDEMALFIDLFHSATNISKTRLAVYWLVREGLGGYVLTDVEAYERELFGKHRMIKPDGLQPAPKP